MKALKPLFLVVFITTVSCSILYLSWFPDPEIGTVFPFPLWLGRWINIHVNLRTAIPFLFLGFLEEYLLIYFKKSQIWRIWALIFSIIVVAIAEIGQLWIPKRHFDYEDIGYGVLGTLAGLLIGYTSFKIKQRVTRDE